MDLDWPWRVMYLKGSVFVVPKAIPEMEGVPD